jgi:soluble lytic murein transglycosylase-like protein
VQPRIVVLLILAVTSGVVAGFVGAATAGKTKTATPPVFRPRLGRCPIPDRYRPAFEKAARETGFDLAMLAAVANVESSFDPQARSAAGAHGLFQILPSTARALHLDVSTPEKNILAGAKYLKYLEHEFQSTELMFAAYNAGPTAVLKAGGAPNAESLNYVNEVEQLWRALHGCR